MSGLGLGGSYADSCKQFVVRQDSLGNPEIRDMYWIALKDQRAAEKVMAAVNDLEAIPFTADWPTEVLGIGRYAPLRQLGKPVLVGSDN